MAVYYIDPYTTTNGTGTWASPWSFASSVRTGLAAGDEVRIVARLLSSMVTATTYTATRPAANQIVITSGGGLGADFATTDLLYFPDYGTFSYVFSIATNTITTTNAILPIPTTASITLNVQRIPVANAPVSAIAQTMYLLSTSLNNVTVTDGWTADGVQVTDGTAASIVRSSYSAVSASSLGIDNTGTPGRSASVTSLVVNAPNTYVLGVLGSGSTFTVALSNVTSLTFKQVFSSSGGAVIQNNASNAAIPTGITYNITHLSSFGANIFTGLQGYNSTFNFTNIYATTTITFGTALFASTVNTETLVLAALPLSCLTNSASSFSPDTTYNITTAIDVYPSGGFTGLTGQFGAYTLNVTGAIYVNRRTSTTTSLTYLFYSTGAQTFSFDALQVPTVSVSGVSYSTYMYINRALINNRWAASRDIDAPGQIRISVPTTTGLTPPFGIFSNLNVLVTSRDGTDPIEILGVLWSTSPSPTSADPTTFPNAYLDAAVFRTAGPSIKVYLGTYTTSTWSSGMSFGVKTIKIPVVSGTTYTISGYIRTDQTTFTNGQCVVALSDGFSTINSQSMTTACIGAWEQFSFSYTAPVTQEILLAVRMKFSAGAKAFWIDDITIV